MAANLGAAKTITTAGADSAERRLTDAHWAYTSGTLSKEEPVRIADFAVERSTDAVPTTIIWGIYGWVRTAF